MLEFSVRDPRLDVLRKRESSTTSTANQPTFSSTKEDLVNIVYERGKKNLTKSLDDLPCHGAVFFNLSTSWRTNDNWGH